MTPPECRTIDRRNHGGSSRALPGIEPQEALESGAMGGAGIGVTTPEPLPADDPPQSVPNLRIAPHLGSATLQTRTKMAKLATDGVLDTLAVAGIAGGVHFGIIRRAIVYRAC